MKYRDIFKRELFQDSVQERANIYGDRYDDIMVGVPRFNNGRNGNHAIFVYLQRPIICSQDSAIGLVEDDMGLVGVPRRR